MRIQQPVSMYYDEFRCNTRHHRKFQNNINGKIKKVTLINSSENSISHARHQRRFRNNIQV